MLKCLMLTHLHIGVAQGGLRGLKLPTPILLGASPSTIKDRYTLIEQSVKAIIH